MKLNDRLQEFVQYFTEGFARIFSPAKDDYKDIGVQPYDCKPYVKTDTKKAA
ncbi:isochorismate synthase [Crocosphaera sp.]|uniref:isochorismate synthase n=1 Tax=Crocosphaera sp. TaxID=2729996 RepID=UPI003F1F8B88|nr:isochorismate synthase [Crocosphaera sp.]